MNRNNSKKDEKNEDKGWLRTVKMKLKTCKNE